MEPGFWRSREFLIAAFLAALVVVSGSVVYATSLEPALHAHRASCTPPAATLTDVAAANIRATDDGVERQHTVTLDEPLALIDVCVELGRLEFEAADAPVVSITFTATVQDSSGRQALDDLDLRVGTTRVGETTHLYAWQANDVHYRYGMFDSRSIVVDAVVRIPRVDTGVVVGETAYGDVRLLGVASARANVETGYGHVRIESSEFGELNVHSGFGSIDLSDVQVENRTGIDTEYGHIDAVFTRLGNATLELRSDYGSVDLSLPAGPSYGFQVIATTEYGDIGMDIGPTEVNTSRDDHGDSRHEARTQDFASKPLRSAATLHSDYGDIHVSIA